MPTSQSPHSPAFAGSPYAQPSPNPHAPSSPFLVTPEQIQAMIDQRMQTFAQSQPTPHCHPHSGAPTAVCGQSGKLKTNKVANTDMAARFGVFAAPVFEIDGDIESGDISRMRKVLTPGHDTVGPGFVLRQGTWPHKMLQSSVPGRDVVEHADLTFHQFINGMISLIISETPADRLDPVLANRFSFLQFLVEMSFNYEHKAIIEIYKEIHNSWQMRNFEWSDSWQSIEEKLKTLRGRYIHSPQPVTFKKNAKCSSCAGRSNGGGGGGGAGNGGNPGAGKQQQNNATWINGVPPAYMKAHNICIRFNKPKGCTEKGSHKNAADSNTTLQHICGGCHAKSVASDPPPCHNCSKAPFKSLFRGW